MALRISHLVVPALFASAVATACSSKAPLPQAFVEVSANSTGSCNFSSGPRWVIGSASTDGGTFTNPVRVPTGTDEGGAVTVSCSVAPSGGNFNIQLYALLDTTNAGSAAGGGSLTVSGTVAPGASGQMTGATNLSATFVAATNTYQASNCTLTYTEMPPGGPVAAGRIWGSLDCPMAAEQNVATPTTCDMSALFVFENCSG